MNWFRTGESAKKALVREQARREELSKQQSTGDRVFRFYLPSKTTTKLTFLDAPTHPQGFTFPFIFKEHQIKMNGSWRNWFTCLAVVGEGGIRQRCPLCEDGDTPTIVSAYTVIDHSEWEKDGKTHKDEIKLFVCKMVTHEKLEAQMAKRGTLRGAQYEVTRGSGDKSANCGDTFDFEGFIDLGQYGNPAPMDYFAAFAPLTPEAMSRAVFGGKVEEPKNQQSAQQSAKPQEQPVAAEGKKVSW